MGSFTNRESKYRMSFSDTDSVSSSPCPSSRITENDGKVQDSNKLTLPFGHRIEFSLIKIVQTVLCALSIFVIRVLLLILTIPITALCAHLASRYISHDEEPVGWKRNISSTACWLGRLQLRIGGLSLTIKGKPADPKDARLLVLAPHSALLDGFCLLYHAKWTHLPSPISAAENRSIPIIGQLLSVAKPIYVDREDAESKKNVVKAINSRVNNLNFPQVAIFPEGTNTNRKALLSFKPGAFTPGLPVQPIILRYSGWDTYTWTYGQNISNLGVLCFLTLCQPIIYLEMEYLSIYKPNEEEKSNPVLYAQNVALEMGKKLNIPISDWGMENGRLLTKAIELDLDPSIIDFNYHQIAKQTQLHWSQMKILLKEYKNLKRNKNEEIRIEECNSFLEKKLKNYKIEKNEKIISFSQFIQIVGPILKDNNLL